MRLGLSILLLMMSAIVYADTYLSFDDLSNEKQIELIHGSSVKMRGFLYLKNDESWVLAAQPNVKSCCVGSKENAKRQVIVHGDIPKQKYDSVVVLEGRFEVKSNSFSLLQAKLVEDHRSKMPFIMIGVLGILMTCFFLWWTLRNK